MRQFASGADTLIAIKQFHTPGETTLAKSAPSRKASAKTAEGEETFALRSLQEAHDASPRYPASDDELLHFYEQMLLIRRFEEKAGQLYGLGLIGGFCHLYIGQEAVAVGLGHLDLHDRLAGLGFLAEDHLDRLRAQAAADDLAANPRHVAANLKGSN